MAKSNLDAFPADEKGGKPEYRRPGQTPRRAIVATTEATINSVRALAPAGPIQLKGKVGRTLVFLVNAGEVGITYRECGHWAVRLAAYIHVLRHGYGLQIDLCREQQGRCWRGRYVLQSPIELLEAPASRSA